MNTTADSKNSSNTRHLESLERQVDRSPGDTGLLSRLCDAYRRAGRFSDASEVQAMLSIPDTRPE